MQTFKLIVVRTQVLEFKYEAEVEAQDIHEAACILREQAEGEIPNRDDIIDDSVRIMARDGAGYTWDIN